ncbi:uncharacterized protein LOC118790681 [Megalops cyprinoides]|uniref:uncharacterized protein LOC118790681 n=1 Tax=Megalops cyprinoides TaxID=118141 RepID=UPI001863ECD6|nr:uncharacterized protein LOC118790681 [Megalops cyprinoides]
MPGSKSDQCERSSGAGSPTQSCVYKLPKRNLSLSDAGTYYCAVATYVTQTERIVQPDLLVTAELGDDVTLQCFYPRDQTSYLSWYKQTVGQNPELISSSYKHSQDVLFYNGFKDSPRFTVHGGEGRNHLTISNLQPSDSAMYYCGRTQVNKLEFEKGIFLILKGSKSKNRTVVQQPVSEPVQPGDSVTLQCTIDTETCAGEHSVYWFRRGSGESSPGVIYTHGNSSDQCERSSGAGSPTQSCVYKLPKRNLSPTDSGTYYCAVATCGEILFGNGTKLELGKQHC